MSRCIRTNGGGSDVVAGEEIVFDPSSPSVTINHRLTWATLPQLPPPGLVASRGVTYAADTSGGSLSIMLPATPPEGAFVSIKDVGGQADVNNITINGNGALVEDPNFGGSPSPTALFYTAWGCARYSYHSGVWWMV